MAFTGGRETYDNPDAIDATVSNLVTLYAPTLTPVLERIGDASTPARSHTYQWLEDEILSDVDTLNDSGGISSGDTSMVVSNGIRFKAYSLVLIESELIMVGAVSGNTCSSLVRGYGGTTAAAHADGSTIRIISSGNIEGADAASAKSRQRTPVTNYCHTFEPNPSQVSIEDETAAKFGAIASESDHQVAAMLVEGMIQLENAVCFSAAHASTPVGSSAISRTMNGLWHIASTNVVAAGGSVLTEDYLNSLLQQFYDAGAIGIDTLILGATQKRKTDHFTLPGKRFDNSDLGLMVQLRTYEHSFSTKPLTIILKRNMPTDAGIFFDSDNCGVVPFVPFMRKNLAEGGFYQLEGVHGSYTLEARHEVSVARVTGLSTS